MADGALAGRTAVVTGAGPGPGRTLALLLAGEGARCAVAARSAGPLRALAAEAAERGGEACPLPADVTDDRAVRRLAEEADTRFGGADVLVNAAFPGSRRENVLDMGPEDLRGRRHRLDTSVYGTCSAAGGSPRRWSARARGRSSTSPPCPAGPATPGAATTRPARPACTCSPRPPPTNWGRTGFGSTASPPDGSRARCPAPGWPPRTPRRASHTWRSATGTRAAWRCTGEQTRRASPARCSSRPATPRPPPPVPSSTSTPAGTSDDPAFSLPRWPREVPGGGAGAPASLGRWPRPGP